MPKFSVKKPFTVLVMVIVMLILGVVSLTKMRLDLLPDISMPYLIAIVTYPGASPEKVEAELCKPLEASLGTVSGVENVYAIANENYGLVELEFADGTDMDSAMVRVSSALNTVKDTLPEECGSPTLMEISTDMMATQYLAVSSEGMTIEELSTFVEENITPRIERQNGVASVSSLGLIEKSIQVELDPDKVDALNDKILAKTNDALAEALEDMEEAKKTLQENDDKMVESRQKLIDGQKDLEDGKQELWENWMKYGDSKDAFDANKKVFEKTESDTYSKLSAASVALDQLAAYKTQLQSQQAQVTALETAIGAIKSVDQSTAMAGLNMVKDLISSCVNGDGSYNETVGNMESTTPGVTNIQMVVGALQSAGVDVTELSTALATYAATGDSSSIATALASASSAVDAKMNALEEASTTLAQYESELTALKLEIQVTQSIIAKYEKELAATGFTAEDIKEAELKAAAEFGSTKAQMAAGESALTSAKAQLEAADKSMEDAEKQLKDGWKSIEDGQKQIDDAWEQYYDGLAQYEKSKAEALRSANADQLLTLSTLSGLIYAQNFSMPAGYIDDAEDNSWLVKVGDHYESVEELSGIVLCHIDDIGDVRLSDVANITVIDNSESTYARLNGEQAVILSVFKSSTAGTNEVSKTCTKLINTLENEYEGLDIMVMMDQGDYINLIVGSVVENMVVGAALAIVVLALFLKDFLPTIVVAISIPLSVLTALIAMYFTNISLNMMSLSGLALGIGMLVDNSIVVIENIYRLRSRGISAPRAAVAGTKQVAGAIIASTLTTVSVFMPMIYTTGMVRELLFPMCLTIIYTLLASLLIAMTVVPAAGSTLLRRSKSKDHPWFEKIQEAYGKTLSYCLSHKLVPLSVAIGLLVFSIVLVLQMGIVLIPNMSSNQIEGTLVYDEETKREDAYAKTDEIINRIMEIDGVANVGVMAGGENSLIGAMAATTEGDYLNYSLMITTENQNAGMEEVENITAQIKAIGEDVLGKEAADENFNISGGMSEMTDMLGSGLSLSIYGDDLDELLAASEKLMTVIDSVEGFTDISNGQEASDPVLHILINKDLAMSKGLTVAQMYQELSAKMTTESTAVTVTIDGVDMDIKVVNHMEPLTYENLMDYTFAVSETDEDGDTVTKDYALKDLATVQVEDGVTTINRENQSRYITVTAGVEEGYNTTLLSRELQPLLEDFIAHELPASCSMNIGGEVETVNEMIEQMALVMLLGIAFIYLVMVAQFQSLLSPFIVLFTIPLAFTGGFLILWIAREPLSMMGLMGLVILLGTVVNNGIVFVDYTNQLRMGGMTRHDALIATGKTRMRPILMTALTTILAMSSMITGDDMGSQMGKGMSLVIMGGLAYATLMTLYIIPVMYDILFKKAPLSVDVGSDNLDDMPDDAGDFMERARTKRNRENGVADPNRKEKARPVDGDPDDLGTGDGVLENGGKDINEIANEIEAETSRKYHKYEKKAADDFGDEAVDEAAGDIEFLDDEK